MLNHYDLHCWGWGLGGEREQGEGAGREGRGQEGHDFQVRLRVWEALNYLSDKNCHFTPIKFLFVTR